MGLLICKKTADIVGGLFDDVRTGCWSVRRLGGELLVGLLDLIGLGLGDLLVPALLLGGGKELGLGSVALVQEGQEGVAELDVGTLAGPDAVVVAHLLLGEDEVCHAFLIGHGFFSFTLRN